MNATDNTWKTVLQTNYSKAQTRLVEMAENAQSSFRTGSERGKEHIEMLSSQFSVRELLDRVRATESVRRTEFLGQLGFVGQADLETLTQTVASLHAELAALRTELKSLKSTVAAKKADVKTTGAKKTGAKKATASKPVSAKATAKKATQKKSSPTAGTKKGTTPKKA